MSYYSDDLCSAASAEYLVVTTKSFGVSVSSVMQSNVIESNTHAIESCPAYQEFETAAFKRSKDKKDNQASARGELLAMWCISTRMYQINEASVLSVTNKEVSTA